MIYIGLDDTDNANSRGTGRLARAIAAALEPRFQIRGVTRHQLLVDPRVPYTSHNSSATIHLLDDEETELPALADQVQAIIQQDFQEGSDPGLCVAKAVTPQMVEFGQRAKAELVRQAEAREIARRDGFILRGLGGTEDGVIGALAGVGLASTGEDGRFILVGKSRELQGVQTVQAILSGGIAQVRTLEGQTLQEGLIETGDRLRPAFRNNRAVLVVRREAGDASIWHPVRLD